MDEETVRAQEEGRQPDLLRPIGLHEARDASLMIAAGVTLRLLQTDMGHSSVSHV
jgi:hypothetical protein